jgi:hypothetical protein
MKKEPDNISVIIGLIGGVIFYSVIIYYFIKN